MTYRLLLSFLITCQILLAQEVSIEKYDSRTNSSFRALSIVDDNIAWISGNKGWFGRSNDGGNSWEFDQVHLFQEMDFRGLYAFDNMNAILFNAGSPAYILRTTDGGKNWLPVYQNSNTDIFLDGIDFWNEIDGVIYGDPIDGKMTLLRTKDAGFTWEEFPIEHRPDMDSGEASFAASGTAIRCFSGNQILIASGGMKSQLYHSNDRGNSWKTIEAGLQQGAASKGIFSLGVNKDQVVIVGGDYLQEELAEKHVLYSENFGRKWKEPKVATLGYRESVEYLRDDLWITCGPGGAEISYDNGMFWDAIDACENMHVVRKARKGELTLMAGRNGMIIKVNELSNE